MSSFVHTCIVNASAVCIVFHGVVQHAVHSVCCFCRLCLTVPVVCDSFTVVIRHFHRLSADVIIMQLMIQLNDMQAGYVGSGGCIGS